MAEAKTVDFWTGKAKWDAGVWDFADGGLPTLKMALAFDQIPPGAEDWAYGEGSEQRPYLIESAEDLAELARQVNDPAARASHVGKHYRLTADIDISEHSKGDGGWIPIGVNRYRSFSGTFDGGGHTVSGLSIDRRTEAEGGDYEGLFGYVYMGTVKNLTVSGTVHGWFESGGIAGYLEGDHRVQGSARIADCRSEVKVYCWGGHAGGIAGYVFNGAVIENCSSSGIVEAQKDELGGIAGLVKSNSLIKSSYSTSRVTGPVNRVGGIAGAVAANSLIENCYSAGDISGADHLGGIAGYVIGSSVKNSYSTGAVYGLADEVYVDGSTYSTSYKDEGGSPELLYVELGDYVGGVAGEVYFGSVVNCYSSGPVRGHKEVGGVVGTLNPGDRVENSAALNPSVTASRENAGRVAGAVYGDGVLNNNYAWSGMAAGEGGAPFTGEPGADVTAERAHAADFWAAALNWSEDVWAFEDGYLPLLKNLEGQARAALAQNAGDPDGDPVAPAPVPDSVTLTPNPGAGGNGEAPAAPAVDEARAAVPDGGASTATVSAAPRATAKGGAKAAPTEGALAAAIVKAVDAAARNGSVPKLEIEAKAPANGTEEAKAVEVEIPAGSIMEAAAKGVGEVRVATAIGEVALDRAAIEALSDQASADVTISIAKLDESASNADSLSLTPQQLARIEADSEIREVFDVSILVGGERVTDFEKGGQKGSLAILLPYGLGSGEDAGRVGVNYIDEGGGSTPMAGARHSGGYVGFTTDHLSVYAVAYRAEATETGPAEGGASSGGCDAGFAGLALLAAALGAATFRKRGRRG
jgi:hypothetical protein